MIIGGSSNQIVHADNFVISDEASCESYPFSTNVWEQILSSKRCKFQTTLEVASGDTLQIASDVTLIKESVGFFLPIEIRNNAVLENLGVIDTRGAQISNGGTLINRGQIDNAGTVTNARTFQNFGSFSSSSTGVLNNQGSGIIENESTGFISSIGTINNDGTITTHGPIRNTFQSSVIGVMNNQGKINNFDSITNAFQNTFSNSGIIDNHDTIENFGVLANTGTINNFCGSVFDGNIPNPFGIFNEFECLVGGEFVPIDSSALLLAGAQNIASWMIPIVVAGVGIGLVLVRRK